MSGTGGAAPTGTGGPQPPPPGAGGGLAQAAAAGSAAPVPAVAAGGAPVGPQPVAAYALGPADLAAIGQAMAAAMPASAAQIAQVPPRDFAAEQNLKDQRSVLQKQLYRYDGSRKVKTLRLWLEVQETYLKTFVPVVQNPTPPPTWLPGVWPTGLDRNIMFSHLKTQVEKGAQTLHDQLEAERDPVTNAHTILHFGQYQTRFVANFLPSTVRNEVEQNLKQMRFMGSMNKLVEDVREQIEEVTAANVLSGGVQATLSNLELMMLFQDMFKRSSHPQAGNMSWELATYRSRIPTATITTMMEYATTVWAALGHTDDSTSRPRTLQREATAGRGITIRGRGRGRLMPYSESMTCHFCGGFGHRSNNCSSNPQALGFGGYRGRSGYPSRGAPFRRGVPGGRGAPAGRGLGGNPGKQETSQGTGQVAGRGQGQIARGRGFPLGPRYRQPYRGYGGYPPYNASPYEIQQHKFEDELEGYGYEEETQDGMEYMNPEQQNEDYPAEVAHTNMTSNHEVDGEDATHDENLQDFW